MGTLVNPILKGRLENVALFSLVILIGYASPLCDFGYSPGPQMIQTFSRKPDGVLLSTAQHLAYTRCSMNVKQVSGWIKN